MVREICLLLALLLSAQRSMTLSFPVATKRGMRRRTDTIVMGRGKAFNFKNKVGMPQAMS